MRGPGARRHGDRAGARPLGRHWPARGCEPRRTRACLGGGCALRAAAAAWPTSPCSCRCCARCRSTSIRPSCERCRCRSGGHWPESLSRRRRARGGGATGPGAVRSAGAQWHGPRGLDGCGGGRSRPRAAAGGQRSPTGWDWWSPSRSGKALPARPEWRGPGPHLLARLRGREPRRAARHGAALHPAAARRPAGAGGAGDFAPCARRASRAGARAARPRACGRDRRGAGIVIANLDAFLEMMAAERGASRHTLDAYRRDLADLRASSPGAASNRHGGQRDDVRAYLAALADAGLRPPPPPGASRRSGSTSASCSSRAAARTTRSAQIDRPRRAGGCPRCSRSRRSRR